MGFISITLFFMKLSSKIISVSIIVILLGGFVFFKMQAPANSKKTTVRMSDMLTDNTVLAPTEIDDYLNDTENIKDPDFLLAKKSLENGDIKNAPILWEKVLKNEKAS